MVGKRLLPWTLTGRSSDLDLFCDFKRIIDLNAEVSHRTLQFRMAEQKLDRAQVLGFPVDERRIRSLSLAVICR